MPSVFETSDVTVLKQESCTVENSEKCSTSCDRTRGSWVPQPLLDMPSYLALLGSLCFRGMRWQCPRSFVENHSEIWACRCIPWTMHKINFKIKSTAAVTTTTLSLNAVLMPSMSFIVAIYANHWQVDLDFDLLIWQNMLTWPGCTQAEPAAAVLT